MSESRTLRSVFASCVAALALLAFAGSAAADSNTNIASFADPRTDLPVRSGQLVKALYGPFTIPANGEINSVSLGGYRNITPPCSNCRITDIVPDLVDSATGASVNLREGPMMHHIVLLNPGKADAVCPGGLPGVWGDRFFAAGNERTHLHLPGNFGYENDNSTWRMIYHLVNKSAADKTVNIQVVYRWLPKADTQPAVPAWLDIDGCNGDSEYTIPLGYSDFHDPDNSPVGGPYSAEWTLPWDARLIAIAGHSHDVDITTPPYCDPHCTDRGGGIAVSAELLGGSGSTYYGPSPTNRAPPSDLTGATLCRSETRFGSAWAGGSTGPWKGHLDTMTLCGIFTSVPAGAQAEAYPVNGAFPANGVRVNAGQRLRLHSEYLDGRPAGSTPAVNDVMGIMLPWFAVVNNYARPGSGTPLRVPLVPAYQQCTSPNSSHVAPLSYSACRPPVEESNVLTTSVGRQSGFLKLTVLPGNPSTQTDEADVNIAANVTDVRRRSDGLDYSGKVLVTSTLRLTDRQNGPAEGATVQDTPFNIPLNCAVTSGTMVGGLCNVSTTADTLIPNTMREGQNMIMDLLSVRAKDAGPNDTGYGAGCPPTCGDGDEKEFLTQGVFAP
jgi:hypothetical protein